MSNDNNQSPVSLHEGLDLEAIEALIRQVFTDEGIGRRYCDTCEAMDHECGCSPSVLELLNQRIINHIMSGIRAQISYQRAIASLGEAPKPEAPVLTVPEIFEQHAGICPTCDHDFTNPPAPEPSPVVEPEEGDKCGSDGCEGVFGYKYDGRCYCHRSPPCHYCVDNPLVCLECGEAPKPFPVVETGKGGDQ